MKTPVRGISKNKVQVMSLNNKLDNNRLVEHFTYLISKGHQVDKESKPMFFSNLGTTRKEIIGALNEYKNNFVQAKKDGHIGRSARLLGKGIVFCNLPHSMTHAEYIELANRISAVIPPEQPQIFVFHNKNRAGNQYGHIHLMLGLHGDGSQEVSKEFKDCFHEKFIDVVNNYTAELGYKRDVTPVSQRLTPKTNKMIRDVARREAIKAGEKDVHVGMINRLKSQYFWDDILKNRIDGENFTSLDLNFHAEEMIQKCQYHMVKYAANAQMAERAKDKEALNADNELLFSKGKEVRKVDDDLFRFAMSVTRSIQGYHMRKAAERIKAVESADLIKAADTVAQQSKEIDVLPNQEPKPQIEVPTVRETPKFSEVVAPEPVKTVTTLRRR